MSMTNIVKTPLQPYLPRTGAPASARDARHLGTAILIAVFVALFALSLPSARGAEAVNQPAPPHIGFLATPASAVYLGMPAQEATRVLGDAAKETDFVADGAALRKLEFSGSIPGRVILSDGKVSRVTLDAFVEEDALPPFIRKAWPGFAASAVRRVLGEPTDVLHHGFFGINIDQWVFSRAGEADVSVFFRDGRLVARTVGRDVPANLFRVALPSPPAAESEGRMPTPRLGMTAGDIAGLYGPVKYRVDYVINGQPASRVVFETRNKGRFAGATFVDGVAIGLEDLGGMPDDPTFQGR
jgi:hypothetical protein